MTKKFLDFFGSDMPTEHKKSFIRALYNGDGIRARKAIYDFAANRKLVLTPVVEQAMI